MSLTTQLRDPNSPLLLFMTGCFPNTRPYTNEARLTLKTRITLRQEEPVHYNTVGTAFDYRFRYYLDILDSEQLIAYHGAQKIGGGRTTSRKLSRSLISSFFDSLDADVWAMDTVGRRLPVEDERKLARYCVVLAWFEQIFRAGDDIQTPLLCPTPRTLQKLLDRVDDIWVDDICSLSYALFDHHGDLVNGRRKFNLNPIFAGSYDVGGADADVILDGCLFDIKCSTKSSLSKEWLYKLVAYALLDYDNCYDFAEVGFYFARQQALIRWNLEDLIAGLSRDSLTLDLSRKIFRKICQSS